MYENISFLLNMKLARISDNTKQRTFERVKSVERIFPINIMLSLRADNSFFSY